MDCRKTMPEAGKTSRLALLRQRLAALERAGWQHRRVLPFGLTPVDKLLPGKGLALASLHEMAGLGGEGEDGAVAAAFLAAILARLRPRQLVLWCLGENDLYAPGLAAFGLDPKRLILVRARGSQEVLWAMEEGLRCTTLAAVVGEVDVLSLPASRRLLLAAESSGVTGFVLRRWRNGETAAQRLAPNAAQTRWHFAALPGAVSASAPGVGQARWRVELWRCRGGVPGSWIMEASDAAGHVSLVAALANRSSARPVSLIG